MNVIYIVCHDLGRMLGAYGRPYPSPYLDRFAAEGVRFTSAFCQSPACSPSRGCAYSGQAAHTNGLMGLVNGGWSLPCETTTFIDDFNRAGFRTAICGLDHAVRNRADLRAGEDLGGGVHAGPVVDRAIAYLEEAKNRDVPFFLHVGTIEVHASQWQEHHRLRDERGLKPSLRLYPWIDENTQVPDNHLVDTPAMRREMGRFQAALAYFDFHMGRLFGALDLLGLRDDTLVVFTTDHGVPGLRAKMTLYEMGVETALLMRGPGLPAGRVVEDLACNVDLRPTMAEAAGLEIAPEIHGQSLWGVAGDRRPLERNAIFTERNYHGGMAELRPDGTSDNYDPMRSVRTGRYHLIRNFDPEARLCWSPDTVPAVRDTYTDWFNHMFAPPTEPRPEYELYDCRKDPWERNNLADEPSLAAVRQDLEARLEQWMRETEDPLLRGPIPDRLNGWPDKE